MMPGITGAPSTAVCQARTRAAAEDGDRGLSDLNVNPDVVVALVFVFDVPESAEPTEARFRGTGRSRFGINVRLERRGR